MRRLVTAGMAALLGLAIGSAGTLAAQGARTVCATEDSPLCVWFGPVQGNGHGSIIVNGGERS